MTLVKMTLILLAAGAGRQTGQVRIMTPANGSHVPARAIVEGTFSRPNTEIWIVVHPMDGNHWVQRPTRTGADGRWRVEVAFGEAGQHQGRNYEFIAVVGPKVELRVGMVLADWPQAAFTSTIVSVIRE